MKVGAAAVPLMTYKFRDVQIGPQVCEASAVCHVYCSRRLNAGSPFDYLTVPSHK